jgi:hypothetical protein
MDVGEKSREKQVEVSLTPSAKCWPLDSEHRVADKPTGRILQWIKMPNENAELS